MTRMIQRTYWGWSVCVMCVCVCEGERYVVMTLQLKGTRLDRHTKRRKDKCACLPTWGTDKLKVEHDFDLKRFKSKHLGITITSPNSSIHEQTSWTQWEPSWVVCSQRSQCSLAWEEWKNLGILFMAERFVWFKLQLMVIKSESLQNDLTSGKQHLVSELLFAIAKMGEMFPNHKMINTKVFLGWFCDRHGNALCVPTSGCFSERGKKRERSWIQDSIYWRLVWSIHLPPPKCVYMCVWPLTDTHTPYQSSTDSVKSPALMTWELTEMFWLEWN